MIEFTGTHPFWALLIGTVSVAIGTMLGCWRASKILDYVDDDETGELVIGPWT